jgi:Ni/Co efflux regulator RcnB
MKQFISVLVAAIFAAASVTAIAQEKKADEKAKAGQMDKKDGKKSTKSTKKSSKPKGEAKKGEPSKKDEAKK